MNEHCIGLLKSKWHRLKHLRTQLNLEKNTKFMIYWIILCAKLHNYVMTMNDECTKEDDEIVVVS